MKRRNFIKLGAAAGLSLVTPWSRHAVASEQFRGFGGPFWITINLKGAWDSTQFCDPKGELTDGSGNGPINSYLSDQIVNLDVGGNAIPLAPCTHESTGSYVHHVPRGGGDPVHVLNHLAPRGVTLLNGVDAGLTNHRSGEQLAIAGSAAAAFPTLPALIAYDRLVDRDLPPNGPMPLLSFGGYDGTANLVPATRLARLDVLSQITRPDAIGPADAGGRIHGDTRRGLITDALLARQNLLTGRAALPSKAIAMSQLFVARSREAHVGRLLDRFSFEEFEALDAGSHALERQAYVALRAFEGGLAVGANLILPGWDSHSYNDRAQAKRMNQLFRALVFIKDEAESLGVADQINIMVGSDFGRTTYYKNLTEDGRPHPDSGKDHHSVTSWMTMLWGSGVEQGVRVVGATTDAVVARGLDDNLQPVEGDGGVVLTPAVVHGELRRLAGLEPGSVGDHFPLDGEALPIWA